MLRRILFAAPFLLASAMVHAGTINQTGSVSLQDTELTNVALTPTLLKFDSGLGTLTSVEVTFNGSGKTSFDALNTSLTRQTFQVKNNLAFTLNSTDSSIDAILGPLALSKVTGTGSKSLDAGASATYGPYDISGSQSYTFTSLGDLALFIGSGSLGFEVNASAGLSVLGGGANIAAQQHTQAAADVTVIYTFTPAAVPEPSSVILLGAAGSLLGIGGAIARRRKAGA